MVAVGSPMPQTPWEKDQERDAVLDNIRLRLQDHYGNNAQLKIQRDSQYFSVEIKHPAFEGGIK